MKTDCPSVCTCTTPSQPDTSIKTTERRYTWIDKSGNLASRKLTAYECKLEDEVQKMQDALFSLSSHYSKIQFRLRQISSATGNERDCLMRELDRVIYQDMDGSRDNYELPSLLEDSKSLGNVRTRQEKIIAQLRSRLTDLAEVADVCFCAESEASYNNRKFVKKEKNAECLDNNEEHDKNCCCIVCKETKVPPSERGYLTETWQVEEENEINYRKKTKSKKKSKKRHGRRERKADKRYGSDSKSRLKYIASNASNPGYFYSCLGLIGNREKVQSPRMSFRSASKRSLEVSNLKAQDSVLKSQSSKYSRSSYQSYQDKNKMNTKKSKQKNSDVASIKTQKSEFNYEKKQVRSDEKGNSRHKLKRRNSEIASIKNQKSDMDHQKKPIRSDEKGNSRHKLKKRNSEAVSIKTQKSELEYQNNLVRNDEKRSSRQKARESESNLPVQDSNLKENRSNKISPEPQQQNRKQDEVSNNEASTSNASKRRSSLCQFFFRDSKKKSLCEERQCEGTCSTTKIAKSKKRDKHSKEKQLMICDVNNCPKLNAERSAKSQPDNISTNSTKSKNKDRRTCWASPSMLETTRGCSLCQCKDKRTSYEQQLYKSLCSRVRKLKDDHKLDQSAENIDDRQKKSSTYVCL